MAYAKREYDFRLRHPTIELTEDYLIYYWTTKFNVSYEKLRQTVADVGPSVKDVAKRLKVNFGK